MKELVVVLSGLAEKQLLTLLLVGKRGVGKRTFLQELICKSSPKNLSEKILSGKCPDILTFSGEEGIDKFREGIQEFKKTSAKELANKWLILNNIDFYSSDICNFLLKTIEDGKDFHILCTSTSRRIQGTLLSRLHSFVFPCLSKERILEILGKDKKLKPLSKHIEVYPFSSIFEIETFIKYEMENLYKGIMSAGNVSDVMSIVDKFWGDIKELPAFEKLPTLEFFVKFFLHRVSFENKPKLQAYIDKLVLRFSESFIKNLTNPLYYFEVNMEQQLRAFFVSVYTLKYLI